MLLQKHEQLLLFLLVEVLQSLQHRRNVVPRLGVEPDLIHRDLTELKLTFLDFSHECDPSKSCLYEPINSQYDLNSTKYDESSPLKNRHTPFRFTELRGFLADTSYHKPAILHFRGFQSVQQLVEIAIALVQDFLPRPVYFFNDRIAVHDSSYNGVLSASGYRASIWCWMVSGVRWRLQCGNRCGCRPVQGGAPCGPLTTFGRLGSRRSGTRRFPGEPDRNTEFC